MWSRLVITDRYLSLMLGLPQGSLEDPWVDPAALQDRTALDRLEHLEAVAGGLIIQRNRANLHNLDATRTVDKLLHEAASLMPAQWWLPPEPGSIAGNSIEAFKDTIRLMNQFAYYHLLAQLHLPYMLLVSDDRRYDYHKITAVNASREILLRFVSFFAGNSYSTYCRGVDFLAFIASITLCLAHIEACRERQATAGDGIGLFQFLVHQRLKDIGMMECILETMEYKARTGDDSISQTIASNLRRLLIIETAVASGSRCTTIFPSRRLVRRTLTVATTRKG